MGLRVPAGTIEQRVLQKAGLALFGWACSVVRRNRQKLATFRRGYAGRRTAERTGRPLIEVLAEDRTVATALGQDRMADLIDPHDYRGAAGVMADRVLVAASQIWATPRV